MPRYKASSPTRLKRALGEADIHRSMCPIPADRKTTVLIADDSSFMRASLSRMIESDDELSVIGTAHNGLEALAKINSLRPDVVIPWDRTEPAAPSTGCRELATIAAS